MVKDKQTEKKKKEYYWYIAEDKLVPAILMALNGNYTAEQFRALLENQTKTDPKNISRDDGGTIKPLSLAQARSKFRKFKKEYDYPHIKLKSDKPSKKEIHEALQKELKEKYHDQFKEYNKKK